MLKKMTLLLSLSITFFSLVSFCASENNDNFHGMNGVLELIKSVGGFYLISVGEIPAEHKKEVMALLAQAAKNEYCDDCFSVPEPHTLVYSGTQGAKEAKRIKQLLEEKGCTVEIIEMVN